jgi:hypothetical protein
MFELAARDSMVSKTQQVSRLIQIGILLILKTILRAFPGSSSPNQSSVIAEFASSLTANISQLPQNLPQHP